MEQNLTFLEDIENLSSIVDDLDDGAPAAALIPTKQMRVSAKPIERVITQPVMPREIDLKEVRWLTITPENYEEQFAIIEAQEGELVFHAMTIPDYEVMTYNHKS